MGWATVHKLDAKDFRRGKRCRDLDSYVRRMRRVFDVLVCLFEKSACRQVASVKKRTSCAKAPMNRSVSSTTVVKKPYPMMLEGMGEKDDCQYNCLFPRLKRDYFSTVEFHHSISMIT